MIDIAVPNVGLPAGCKMEISAWFVRIGDRVIEGDRLVEILGDDFTFDISCPASGVLASLAAKPGKRIQPGSIIGKIEAFEDD